MKPDAARDVGFSLAEVLLATLLSGLVVAALVPVATAAEHLSRTEAEAADMQQRARAGLARLFRDAYAAGAGVEFGERAGPLWSVLPPVLPRRIGRVQSDAPQTARPDVVSFITVPDTVAQSALLVPGGANSASLDGTGGCRTNRPSCGFAAGMGSLVFDQTGRFGLFTVLEAQDGIVQLSRRGQASSLAYPAGSTIAEVDARTYYFDRQAGQLRQYDTDVTDSPVVDEVSEFHVNYIGTAGFPVSPKPPLGQANCLYDASGSYLLPEPAGGSGEVGLVPLPLAVFQDGPWCGAGDLEFDVDLLRIRRLRFVIGVRAALGGSGDSGSAWRLVPDQTLAIEVSVRNADLSR